MIKYVGRLCISEKNSIYIVAEWGIVTNCQDCFGLLNKKRTVA